MRPSPCLPGRLALLGFLAAALALSACDDNRAGDPPADAAPSALGSGSRIAAVNSPDAGTASGATVYITGASFLTVDSYDETMDGKSKGTVYLQDVGSQAPYSGTSLYSPTYEPPDLVPAPGDVLDLTGTYTINTSLGSAMFPAGTGLIQIDKPTVLPRFEYVLPTARVTQALDLDSWSTGLQWTNMLVTLENVTLPDSLVGSEGRFTVHVTSDVTSNGPTLDNELFDLQDWNSSQPTPPLTKGTVLKSVTGVVTWFFNFHIAPRSPADIVVQ